MNPTSLPNLAPAPGVDNPALRAAWERYPPGAPVRGCVKRVAPDFLLAWLRLPNDLEAVVAACDIGPVGVLRIAQALQRGQSVEGVSKEVVMRSGRVEVRIQLPGLQVPTVDQQLRVAGITAGKDFEAQVQKAVGTDGLLVEILPGINGFIDSEALGGRAPSSYPRGCKIGVRVRTAHESHRRPGKASIRLRLLDT